MRGSRLAAPLFCLTAVLAVAGCGVPPSGVIEAGEPASGMHSPSADPTMASVISLYFLHNGDLTPYPRKIADPGEASAVVRLLFGGPSKSEAATATTDLPRLTGVPKVEIGSDNTFIVQLPDDVSPLSRVAMRQLACTVAHVALPFAALPTDTIADGAPSAPAQPQRSRSVRVLGNGWTMAQSDDACPAPFRP